MRNQASVTNITGGLREQVNQFVGYAPFDVEELHTHDRNVKRRIYDRLRKASFRKLWTLEHYYSYEYKEHQAYVRGVRDALNELPNG